MKDGTKTEVFGAGISKIIDSSQAKNFGDLDTDTKQDLLQDCMPGDEDFAEENGLNKACDQIQIEKSSMDENEIEKNLDNFFQLVGRQRQ